MFISLVVNDFLLYFSPNYFSIFNILAKLFGVTTVRVTAEVVLKWNKGNMQLFEFNHKRNQNVVFLQLAKCLETPILNFQFKSHKSTGFSSTNW